MTPSTYSGMHTKLLIGGCGILLLLVGGCHDPLLLEDRVTLLRLRGVIAASTADAPLQGARVTLGRVVIATDTGDEILAYTETDASGSFSLDRQISCGPLSLLRINAWAPGYASVRGNVQCTRHEQIFNFVLSPDPGPP